MYVYKFVYADQQNICTVCAKHFLGQRDSAAEVKKRKNNKHMYIL